MTETPENYLGFEDSADGLLMIAKNIICWYNALKGDRDAALDKYQEVRVTVPSAGRFCQELYLSTIARQYNLQGYTNLSLVYDSGWLNKR